MERQPPGDWQLSLLPPGRKLQAGPSSPTGCSHGYQEGRGTATHLARWMGLGPGKGALHGPNWQEDQSLTLSSPFSKALTPWAKVWLFPILSYRTGRFSRWVSEAGVWRQLEPSRTMDTLRSSKAASVREAVLIQRMGVGVRRAG